MSGFPVTAARPPAVATLLDEITRTAVDPAYQAAAAHPSARRTILPAAAGLGLVGLLLGVAVGSQRGALPAASRDRAALAAEVSRRTAADGVLAEQARALRTDVTRLSGQQLAASRAGQEAAARLRAVELAAGVTRVRGPGLTVNLGDAPTQTSGPADAGSRPAAGAATSRILDRDIQDVVNALWAAGAEAISVAGIRLTAQTAIRSAGEAVLVDFRPVTSPYLVAAIGDRDTLETGFADSAIAQRFATLRQVYGLELTVARATDLDLPAALSASLRRAVPLPRASP